MTIRLKALARGTIVFSALTQAAIAQDQYPKGPITIIVPFAAGGPSDVISRTVGEQLARQLGQRVIIQNVGGAGGTIGTARAAMASPDGYTLLSHHIGLATAPALYKSLSFDPLNDLATIGLVAEAPMAIIARKDFPPNTLKELVTYLRERQQTISYANAGIGAASFLCGLLLGQRIDVRFTNVPYTGTGPAYSDLLAGRTDLMCDLTTGNNAYIDSGRLKPYAVTTNKRLATLPGVPTADEAGLPNFTMSTWYGLYAPARTPDSIIQRLSKALQIVLEDKETAEHLALTGTTLVTADQGTPEALRHHLKQEIELWTSTISKAGFTPN